MDSRIESLKSTTFCGRRLTRRQIADVQETVALSPALNLPRPLADVGYRLPTPVAHYTHGDSEYLLATTLADTTKYMPDDQRHHRGTGDSRPHFLGRLRAEG